MTTLIMSDLVGGSHFSGIAIQWRMAHHQDEIQLLLASIEFHLHSTIKRFLCSP